MFGAAQMMALANVLRFPPNRKQLFPPPRLDRLYQPKARAGSPCRLWHLSENPSKPGPLEALVGHYYGQLRLIQIAILN